MADFRPKSDTDYRRDHSAGCRSSADDDGSSDRRRRRSDLDGDDLAESSAAVRRHSRILIRWVARQAEDMITTIERRNRESELMALAGLHTVSMLGSSFLRVRESDSPAERRPTASPPARSSSPMLQRWRELEEEARVSRGDGDRSSSSLEQSPEVGDGEGERESVREIIRGMTEVARVSPESPRAEWLGETERERVRLVRERVQTTATTTTQRERRREEGEPLRIRGRQAWLDLITRIVCERQRELQGISEHRMVTEFPHRNRIQSFLRGSFLRTAGPVEEERSPSVAARELGQLRQRHSVSGLREGFSFRLENSVHGQARSPSDTSTRSNINELGNDQSQSASAVDLSNENHVQYQSMNGTTDVHQTVEAHATADLEGSIANESTDWPESVIQGESWQDDAGHEESDWQHNSEIGYSRWRDRTGEESDGNWQENIDQEWSRESPEDEDEDEESHILEENDEWQGDGVHENVEDWQYGPADPPRDQRSIPLRRVSRFIPPDDDNVYSMELRELLGRRSVSNLLHSGFRESLDQLIQSYVQRQGHTSLDITEEDQGQGIDVRNQDPQGVARPPSVLPSPPVPPPQPLWHSEVHHNNWARQRMPYPETEWDTINDLRANMARLEQGMTQMQRMLEACMDMQLELQRSVRQEVSAALNRSTGGKGLAEEISRDGSKWGHIRKGTCCVCCDSHIDALLYRCGHMCTCSECANELIGGGGNCPLCHAPIIEAIRAYPMM